jgi:soluble lytic murein transglycosylase
VRATRLLAILKQDKLVKTFVRHLAATTTHPADWTLLARLATDLKRNDLAIQVAKLAIRQGVVLTVAGYPKLTVGRKFSVEQALIHAVIRQESAFDPKAISRAGARGLMQLMPATAKSVARQLKIHYSKQKLTASPVHNVRLGSAYLGKLRDNYDGSLILTLAAYNAGPGNVRRWIKLNGDPRSFSSLDAIDWIESIPVSETRNYVQRVLENLTIYGFRFENGFLPALIVDAMTGTEPVDYH